jgi:phage shock protein C
MALSEELNKLDDLRQRGVLTDAEFAQAKARTLGGLPPPTSVDPVLAAINGLRRSRSDRWIAGVCGGLARSMGVESWVCRLIVASLFLCGGVGLLLYVLLWIFVPAE